MNKSNTEKQKQIFTRIDLTIQREALIKLRETVQDKSVRRMIDLAIEGLNAGVPRMKPEEITEFLGRNK